MSEHRYYIVPVFPVGEKKKELAEQIRNYMLEQGWIYPELQEVFYYGEIGYTFTNKGIIEFLGEKNAQYSHGIYFQIEDEPTLFTALENFGEGELVCPHCSQHYARGEEMDIEDLLPSFDFDDEGGHLTCSVCGTEDLYYCFLPSNTTDADMAYSDFAVVFPDVGKVSSSSLCKKIAEFAGIPCVTIHEVS